MKLLKIIGIMLWALVNVGKLTRDGAPVDEYEEWEEPEPGWLATFFQIFFSPDSDVAQDVCPSYYRRTIA